MLINGSINVLNVPLCVLFLEELLNFFGKCSRILLRVVVDTLDMKHIGLILLGVLIDLRVAVSAELSISPEEFIDIAEDLLILILALLFKLLVSGQSLAGDVTAFLDIADIEEDTCVSKCLFIFLGVWDGNFVDFDGTSKERLDYSFHLFLQVLIIEVPGLIFLYLFFREAVSLQLDHHLGEILGDDGSGDADLLLEDCGPVQGFLDVECIVFGAVVDERKSFAFLELGHGMSQSEDGLDVEVMLYHGSGNALLKARDEDSSGKLFFLFLLLVEKCGVDDAGAVAHGEVRSANARGKWAHWHSHDWIGVGQGIHLLYCFLQLLKQLYLNLRLRDLQSDWCIIPLAGKGATNGEQNGEGLGSCSGVRDCFGVGQIHLSMQFAHSSLSIYTFFPVGSKLSNKSHKNQPNPSPITLTYKPLPFCHNKSNQSLTSLPPTIQLNYITMSKPHHEIISDNDEQDFENFKGQNFQSTCYQSCLQCCGTFTGCLKIWAPCVCCCCKSPIYQIETAKVGVHQSFGRYLKILKPGFHIINPISESVIEVDMKTSIFGMAPQQVITKDNVSMQIETVVYYRAINPYKLVYKLRNSTGQIREFIKEISYSALRSVIGENIFQQLLEHRAKLAGQLEEYVKEKVYPWGLYIQNIFIKDVILSPDVQKNLQSAAIQKRMSQATIISAKADVQSAKLLKETSQILNSGSAMQIRYLQAMQNITNKCANKTIFMSLKGKE